MPNGQEIYEKIVTLEEKQRIVQPYQKWLYALQRYRTKLSSPLKTEISITGICNQKCEHCSNGGGNKKGVLRLKLLKEILKWHPGYIVLTGGEPFLHPEIDEIIYQVKSDNAFLRICTNGTLLSAKINIDFLEAMDENDIIQISFDAADKETYAKMRGSDNFEKVLTNIRSIKKRYPYINIELHCVPTQYNITQLTSIYRLANQLGVSYFSVSPLAPLGNASELNEIPTIDLMQAHCNLLEQAANFSTAYIGRPYELEALYGMIAFNNVFNAEKSYSCAAGFESIYVDHYGNIYPCVYMQIKDFCLGHVSDGIENIRNICNQKLRPCISLIDTPCGNCYMWGLCNGGCLGLSYARRGKCEPGYDVRCKKENKPNRECDKLTK